MNPLPNKLIKPLPPLKSSTVKRIPSHIPSPQRSKLPPLSEAIASFQKVRRSGLSGVKDIDLKILSELEDRDLFSFCLADKAVNKMCKDENFWRNRFVSRFGQIDKPESWRQYYLEVVGELSKYENPWEFLNNFKWYLNDWNFGAFYYRRKIPDDMLIPFKFLEMGKELTLYFILELDDEGEHPLVKRVYKSDVNFTPEKILQIVYDFYQEPITKDEYELTNARDYDFSEVEAGKVKRIYLLIHTAFGGFSLYKDGRILDLYDTYF